MPGKDPATAKDCNCTLQMLSLLPTEQDIIREDIISRIRKDVIIRAFHMESLRHLLIWGISFWRNLDPGPVVQKVERKGVQRGHAE